MLLNSISGEQKGHAVACAHNPNLWLSLTFLLWPELQLTVRARCELGTKAWALDTGQMEHFCSTGDQKSNVLVKTARNQGLLLPSELWFKTPREYVRNTDIGMKPPGGTRVELCLSHVLFFSPWWVWNCAIPAVHLSKPVLNVRVPSHKAACFPTFLLLVFTSLFHSAHDSLPWSNSYC